MTTPTWNDKDLLIVRLWAERARLLRALVGIDAAALAAARPAGEWSLTELLTHLAEYDQLFARVAADALAGRLATTGIDYTPAHNAGVASRAAGMKLDQAVATLEKQRTQFMTALMGARGETWTQQQRYPVRLGSSTSETRGSLHKWARERALHDAVHTRDLQRWRQTLGSPFNAGPKSIVIAALRAARHEFTFTSWLIAQAERESRPVCGVWTLSDLYGHLADCDSYYLVKLGLMLGDRVQDVTVEENEDTQNARWAEARRGQSFAQTSRDAVIQRERLIERLERAPDAALSYRSTGTDSPYPTAYHCAWSALEHYLDHAAGLRRELGVPLPKALLHFSGPYA
jgi:uncharacterized damage-inducible protein DinB